MKVIHAILILTILVGSDVLIGFYGHYTGSTDDELTIESFSNYIQSVQTQQELIYIILFAIIILLIIRFILHMG